MPKSNQRRNGARTKPRPKPTPAEKLDKFLASPEGQADLQLATEERMRDSVPAHARLGMLAINHDGRGTEGKITYMSPSNCELTYPDGQTEKAPWTGVSLGEVQPAKPEAPADEPATKLESREAGADMFNVPIKPGCIIQTEARGVDASTLLVTHAHGDALIGIELSCASDDYVDEGPDLCWRSTGANCCDCVVIHEDVREFVEELDKLGGGQAIGEDKHGKPIYVGSVVDLMDDSNRVAIVECMRGGKLLSRMVQPDTNGNLPGKDDYSYSDAHEVVVMDLPVQTLAAAPRSEEIRGTRAQPSHMGTGASGRIVGVMKMLESAESRLATLTEEIVPDVPAEIEFEDCVKQRVRYYLTRAYATLTELMRSSLCQEEMLPTHTEETKERIRKSIDHPPEMPKPTREQHAAFMGKIPGFVERFRVLREDLLAATNSCNEHDLTFLDQVFYGLEDAIDMIGELVASEGKFGTRLAKPAA